MEWERKISKHVPTSLIMVAMHDIEYEIGEIKYYFTTPIYQCQNSKTFSIFFEPTENVLIIGTGNDFMEAGNNLRNNLIEYYRKKK
jgi:hypothetical protein